MEHNKGIIPTILMLLLFNLTIISIFWYVNLNKFDTYEVIDKEWLTYQEAKDNGIKVSPENRYYVQNTKIIQRTKSMIPLIYNKEELSNTEGYFSEKVYRE